MPSLCFCSVLARQIADVTDYNLAKMAEFHGCQWLNINHLSNALRQELNGRRDTISRFDLVSGQGGGAGSRVSR